MRMSLQWITSYRSLLKRKSSCRDLLEHTVGDHPLTIAKGQFTKCTPNPLKGFFYVYNKKVNKRTSFLCLLSQHLLQLLPKPVRHAPVRLHRHAPVRLPKLLKLLTLASISLSPLIEFALILVLFFISKRPECSPIGTAPGLQSFNPLYSLGL